MWIDLAILIAIFVLIYYLRMQSGDAEAYNPVSGLQAFLSLGG